MNKEQKHSGRSHDHQGHERHDAQRDQHATHGDEHQAGVLAPLGILLSPAVGALLMSLSTVIVAVNAQLLRRHQFEGQTSV